MKTFAQISLTLLAWITLATAPDARVTAEPIPDEYKVNGFAIGAQAYTFNRFSALEAIEKTAAAGGRVIEFYPGQKLSPEEPNVKWDHNASEEVIQKVKEKLAKHRVHAANYGVVGIPTDETAARKVFEFAKKLGLYAITTESVESIDTIEKLVKEFDVRVAFHNHPRRANNPNYKVWDPNYVLSVVKDRDARIGACADTGHWLASGIQPVDAVKILRGRVISSHLKERKAMGAGQQDIPFGMGVGNIGAVLDELRNQGFQGNISIEYEANWEHSVPDVAQCVGFVRGYSTRR